jgi:drug/metabolite transporter (DMT)-like permease
VRKPGLSHFAFAGCAIIWGSTFLVIRLGNDSLPSFWALALRMLVAAFILNLILLVTRQKWPRGAALKAAMLYGFWEFGVSMALLYWGEKVIASGLAAVLYAICPVAAIFTGKLLGMEEFNLRKLAGAILAFVGVAVIFWREIIQGGSPLAMFSAFLAAWSAPFAAFMLQKGPKQSPVAVNAVGTVVGFATALLWSLVFRERQVIPTTGAEIYPVLYLATMGSVGAFVMFAWLLNRWPTSVVAFLGVIIPVIAVILGALVRHEPFAAWSLAGAAIVIVGVVIALKGESANDEAFGIGRQN